MVRWTARKGLTFILISHQLHQLQSFNNFNNHKISISPTNTASHTSPVCTSSSRMTWFLHVPKPSVRLAVPSIPLQPAVRHDLCIEEQEDGLPWACLRASVEACWSGERRNRFRLSRKEPVLSMPPPHVVAYNGALLACPRAQRRSCWLHRGWGMRIASPGPQIRSRHQVISNRDKSDLVWPINDPTLQR